MGEIIAIVSQKGGVGKTTTAINLGASLAMKGKSVLLIDMDPQRQVVASFQVSDYQMPFGLLDFLGINDKSAEEAIYHTSLSDLKITALVPPGIDEEQLNPILHEKEDELKQIMEEISSQFDFIIIDSPSSTGIFTEIALKIAHSVIVPVQCEYYALKSLGALLKYIKQVKLKYNSALRYRGFLITMVDLRSKLARLVWQRLQSTLSGTLFRTHIPRNIRLAEVPLYGKPVLQFDEKSKGAQYYLLLAEEILHQSGTHESTLSRTRLKIANNY